MWTITIDNLPSVQLNVQGYVGPELAQAINDSPGLNETLSATWDDNTPALQLSNLTSNNVRVRMTKTGWAVAVPAISQNPTAHQSVTEESVYELIFCLSAAQTISCVGATDRFLINSTFSFYPFGPDMVNVDPYIKFFVNGVHKGTFKLWPFGPLPSLVSDILDCNILPAIGYSYEFVNKTSDYLRIEMVADVSLAGEYLGLTNLVSSEDSPLNPTLSLYDKNDVLVDQSVGNAVAYPDGTKGNLFSRLQVCLAPADDGDCVPTNTFYTGFTDIVDIPQGSYPQLYFKVEVVVEEGINSSVTEYILSVSVDYNTRGVLFVELLNVIYNVTPLSFNGNVTAVHGVSSFNYDMTWGQFNVLTQGDEFGVEGFAIGEGHRDVATTIRFLTPTQAELDDYSNQHEVTAFDGALLLFSVYPTWHSCSYIAED